MSGYVYTDANQTQEHPTLDLISAIINNKLLSSNDGQENRGSEADGVPLHKSASVKINLPQVTYQGKRHAMPLND